MTNEEWRLIDGHPGYEVSDLGRVRSLARLICPCDGRKPYRLAPRVLRLALNPNGYWSVMFDGKRHLVHRLVAAAFLPPDVARPMVNHIDGNKRNARLSNLEWTNKSENAKHSFHVLGQRPPLALKPVVIGGVRYDSLLAAGDALGVSAGAIHSALSRPHRIKGMEVRLA